jgi:hypothetical protein
LEELDGIDWLRLQRAAEVERIVNVESRRKAYLNKHVKSLDDHEWQAIGRHDDALRDVYGEDG